MKIRMRTGVAGSFHGQYGVQRGDVIEVPDSEGARYCQLGYCDPVADLPAPETAVVPEDSQQRTVPADEPASPPAPKRRGRPRKG